MVDVVRPPAYARFGNGHHIRNKRKKQQDLKGFDGLVGEPVDLGAVAIEEFSDHFVMPSNGQLAIRARSHLPAQSLLVQKNEQDAFTHPEMQDGDVFKGRFAYVNEQIRITATPQAEEGEFDICIVDALGVAKTIAYGVISATGVKLTSATLTGTGTLQTAATMIMLAMVAMTGLASLMTTTQLIPAGEGEIIESSVTFSSTGGMTAAPVTQMVSSAHMTGAGTISAAPVAVMPTGATMQGTGAISTTTELIPYEPGGDVFESDATFSGTGGISADAMMILMSSVSFEGTGALSATPEVNRPEVLATALGGAPNDNSVVDVTMPSGLTAGELIVVYVTLAGTVTIDTGVSGTNWVVKENRSETGIRMVCYYKIAEGGDALRLNGAAVNGMSCISYRIKGGTDVLNASNYTAASGKPDCPVLTVPTNLPGYEYLWLANIGAVESGTQAIENITGAPANMGNLLKSFSGSATPQSGANRAMAGASLNTAPTTTFNPDEFVRATNTSAGRIGFTTAIYKARPSPIQRVGAVSGAGNGSGLTLPSHQAGDLLVAFAYRVASSVAPSNPSGWTSIDTAAGTSSTNACRVSYIVATDGSTAAPSFTNASFVAILVYRHARVVPLNYQISGAGSGASIPYAALTNNNPDLTSWMIAFAGHRASDGDLDGNPPTGFGTRTNTVGTGQIAAYDTNGGVKAFASETVNIGGTSNNRCRAMLELTADWTLV